MSTTEKNAQFPMNPASSAGNRLEKSTKKNAPSKKLLRPAPRLTSAEAVADRETINLRCSVLGANATLDTSKGRVKASSAGKMRILRTFP
jgi:hypothetical protein